MNLFSQNWKRWILYVLLALITVGLWNAWNKDYPAEAVTNAPHTVAPATPSSSSFVPIVSPAGPTSSSVGGQQPVLTGAENGLVKVTKRYISVHTDVFKAKIDPDTGSLVSIKLLKYPVSLDHKQQKVQILRLNSEQKYVAESGLVQQTNKGSRPDPIQFKPTHWVYQLQADQNSVQVNLRGRATSGLQVSRTYTFKKDSYAVGVKDTFTNTQSKPWLGAWYRQIVQTKPSKKQSMMGSHAYEGGAISSKEHPYKKISFKKMAEKPVNQTIKSGWAAMQQHYFLTAVVPQKNTPYHFYSHVQSPSITSGLPSYTLGFIHPVIQIAPAQSMDDQATVYVGPELPDRLKKITPSLALTVDYGWLWFISKIIFQVMAWMYTVVGNWGVTIILVTVLIKMLFYPLSATSYKSMARMRDLQPKIEALKKQHVDDKQGLGQATMALYKKEKVNPAGGCLPMLIQIPVFIALYYVLIESVALRQAPFIFWIHDLSLKDPYYVLPILMGISMFLQQRMSPQPADPMQGKIMMALPVVMTYFFSHFPSGLVLYWLFNNLVSITQQYYVMNKHSNKRPSKGFKQKKLKLPANQ